MKVCLIFFYTSFFVFFKLDYAYAYLDPGSGSIILQLIIGFLAAVGAFFNKIKIFIYKLLGIQKKNSKDKKS